MLLKYNILYSPHTSTHPVSVTTTCYCYMTISHMAKQPGIVIMPSPLPPPPLSPPPWSHIPPLLPLLLLCSLSAIFSPPPPLCYFFLPLSAFFSPYSSHTHMLTHSTHTHTTLFHSHTHTHKHENTWQDSMQDYLPRTKVLGNYGKEYIMPYVEYTLTHFESALCILLDDDCLRYIML